PDRCRRLRRAWLRLGYAGVNAYERRRPSRNRLLAGRRFFGQGLERFSLELAIVLQQDFNLAFSFLKFFAAGVRKLHAFLEKGERLFQGHIAFFEFLHDLLKTLETFFE